MSARQGTIVTKDKINEFLRIDKARRCCTTACAHCWQVEFDAILEVAFQKEYELTYTFLNHHLV